MAHTFLSVSEHYSHTAADGEVELDMAQTKYEPHKSSSTPRLGFVARNKQIECGRPTAHKTTMKHLPRITAKTRMIPVP